ncbi:MAG: hypothetical protein ACXWFG_14460, partial [Methylobacter sp.]
TLVWFFAVSATGVVHTLATPIFGQWQSGELAEMTAPYRNMLPVRQVNTVQKALDAALRAAPGMSLSFIAFPGNSFAGPRHFVAFMQSNSPLTSKMQPQDRYLKHVNYPDMSTLYWFPSLAFRRLRRPEAEKAQCLARSPKPGWIRRILHCRLAPRNRPIPYENITDRKTNLDSADHAGLDQRLRFYLCPALRWYWRCPVLDCPWHTDRNHFLVPSPTRII